MAKTASRKIGVSRSVKYGSGGGRFGLSGAIPSARIGILQREQNRRAVQERYTQLVAGLGHESRAALDQLAGVSSTATDSEFMVDDVFYYAQDDNDNDAVDDPNANRAEEFIVDVRDCIGFRRSKYPLRRKHLNKDNRTWRNRLETRNAKWDLLIPSLADAFVEWKYVSDTPNVPLSQKRNDFTQTQGHDFGIDILDVYSLGCSAFIKRDSNTEAQVALVQSGYLGNTPDQPSIAISLRTLELFYTMRLFKTSLSVESFAKVLCYVYKIPFRRFYQTALSDTFDIYLEIRCKVDEQVKRALRQDKPNYRALNSCPACCYELEDEAPQIFSRMWAIDGGNSLRRMKPVGNCRTGDQRVFTKSDYILPTEFVDQFANEVKARVNQPNPDPGTDENDEDEGEGEEGGDPTDGSLAAFLATCTKNWKAASAETKKRMWNVFEETKKRMWNVFEETGIFASACRHGFILWVADMI
ncbi:hypothetical protein VKT23_012383 [Stygiomarasmius scandens]|uniref:CxC1-like cysteine cluster associated with KDZ transposases domain-containing protein n=1 Tax=Marasmiellus scandens TaxID=2682957 RepID=A0ABR1J6N5_9AGAR